MIFSVTEALSVTDESRNSHVPAARQALTRHNVENPIRFAYYAVPALQQPKNTGKEREPKTLYCKISQTGTN
ncbi:hypothetical protein ACQY1G_05955 [Agrobacterium vitis]|uniref:hypothetical protein n=1 Tax=Agrobacterium vitis TaxID=373 RepID=UPI003D285B71